jgi:hypothetical protein
LAEPNRKPASKPGRRSQPISRHPLFPAIVALWFAALFGLASFAIRASLLESLVAAGHIDRLVPAAAPPLGTTARLLLALVLGGFGGLVGGLLAWRMAGRRTKPAPSVLKVSEVDLDEPIPSAVASENPVAADEPVEALEPVGRIGAAEHLESEPEVPDFLEPDAVVIDHADIPAPRRPSAAADRLVAADLDTLSHVQLVERLAIAIQRRQQQREEAEASGETAGPSPVVQFPGQADRQNTRPGPSRLPPLETEKALREALATLQRMSGTG